MAAKKNTLDTYANIAAISVVESSATTQTAAKFAFPFSIMDKMAILVSRIEYWWQFPSRLVGADDYVIAALSASATIIDLSNQADPLIIDSARLYRMDAGTAATATYLSMPFVKDFSDLPGGGILMAPSPLYAMVQSYSTSNPLGVWMRLYYTYMEMATDEYWQLVESRRIISS